MILFRNLFFMDPFMSFCTKLLEICLVFQNWQICFYKSTFYKPMLMVCFFVFSCSGSFNIPSFFREIFHYGNRWSPWKWTGSWRTGRPHGSQWGRYTDLRCKWLLMARPYLYAVLGPSTSRGLWRNWRVSSGTWLMKKCWGNWCCSVWCRGV